MEPPLLNSPGPSYAELFSKSAFSQRPFLSARKLVEEARARGIVLDHFARQQLVMLDSVGSFCPIAFSQANYDVETTWLDPDPTYLVWREERHFEPWNAYAWATPQSGERWVSEKYSPWQLLYLEDALRLGSAEVSVEMLDSPASMRLIRDRMESGRQQRRTFDERWRPFLKLLVAVQTRLWPYRRQKTTLLHSEDLHEEPVNPLEVEAARFDARAIMHDFGLDFGGLASLHADLSAAAMSLDPAPGWHRLAEAAPRVRTDEFRGQALRARDLNDACFLVRHLYHLATGNWLPRSDELHEGLDGPPDRRRRHLPRADGQRRGHGRVDIRETLEREGLYPHRIHFVVEGETEEIVLNRLLDAFVEPAGYQLTNLRGVDKAKQHEALFAAASQYAARTVLMADMEGSLSTALKQLQRQDLLTNGRDLLLWEVDGDPSSFEEANFTADEVADAIVAAVRERVPELEISVTGYELSSAFDEALDSARHNGTDRPAFARVVLRYVRDTHQVLVSKTELAHHLAETTMEIVRAKGSLYEAGTEDRPLLRRLWLWLKEVE